MLPRDSRPRSLVETLGLSEHPEGGWYRRVWTASDATAQRRGSGSSIQYLIDADTEGRWHRVDAFELWISVLGAPIELFQFSESSGRHRETIGSDNENSGHLQTVIEPGVWQRARTTGAWSLAVCVVVPEFRFEGFELAPQDWDPPGLEPT